MSARSLHDVIQRLRNAAAAAGRPAPRLVAVSKTRGAGEVEALARVWCDAVPGVRPAFGENYVQEALVKQDALGDASDAYEWHLIGHLQSNKVREAASRFDWVQSVDRIKLVEALARFRPRERASLNVLIQVNVDDEPSKHGCRPEDVPALANAIAAHPTLALRGLMAIPFPHGDARARRPAFARIAALSEALRATHPAADTLSMGMSDDLEVAIAEGATMVRIGTALFGPREAKSRDPEPGPRDQ